MTWEGFDRWANRAQIPLTLGGYIGWAYALWPKNAVFFGYPKDVNWQALFAAGIVIVGLTNLVVHLPRSGTSESPLSLPLRPPITSDAPSAATPKSATTTKPSLPSWLSPSDRKRLLATLKDHQDKRITAKISLCKVRILYSPTENATRLAQELGVIFTEAGWRQELPPTIRTAAIPPLPNGISITSSLSEPAHLAALFLGNAFNEIGLKHLRTESADFRQFDYCFVFIEEEGT